MKSAGNHRSQCSTPINKDKYNFLNHEDDANINWDQLYKNAEECQSHHNKYFGKATLDLDSAMKPSKDYARCTFNLPGFTVEPMKADYRGKQAAHCSPCIIRLIREPGDDLVAGKNYLPDWIGTMFNTIVYCKTLPQASGSREANTEDDAAGEEA